MKRISLDSVAAEASLTVSDWTTEIRDGQETCFLCVYYERFGFGMSLEQVEQSAAKLDALLTRGEASDPRGEIQIDRTGADDGCVMIAFRPGANHASRYFDFPEDAARSLLAKLQTMLTRAERNRYSCLSAKGSQT